MPTVSDKPLDVKRHQRGVEVKSSEEVGTEPVTHQPVADPAFSGGSKTSEKDLAPTPSLQGSKRLLDLMLAGDKQKHLEALNPDAQHLTDEVAFAKHVGRLLMGTPHAAPPALILKTLKDDAQVAARYPALTMEDLNAIHHRFPDLVPLPTLPVDFGAHAFPTVDGYIDLFLSKFLASRTEVVDKAVGLRGAAHGYWQGRYQGARGEQEFPQLHVWMSELDRNVGKLKNDHGKAGLFLRRIIENAPPTWGPRQICEAYNKDLEFYAAMAWAGDKDTLDAARERMRMTPERVRQIMDENPHQSCATVHAERTKLLRETLANALKAAQPDDNLYTLLAKTCEQLAQAGAPRKNDGPNDVYQRLKRMPVPPSPFATMTPEDLAQFLGSDAVGQDLLSRFTEARRGTLDKRLAQGIVDTIGGKLGRTSLTEVVRIMKGVDEAYNEDVVRHLFASFPELFPVARVETAKVEANFLLANQVADAMDRMFEGATLADVAEFLKKTNPTFAASVPDFSVADVKLLQQAYTFLPRWEVKPKGATASSGDKMSLDAFLVFAAKALGTNDKSELRALVLESLDEGLRTGKVPARLEAALAQHYRRALLSLVQSIIKLQVPLSMEAAPLRALLEGQHKVPTFIDESELKRLIASKEGCGRPGDAAALARVLDRANKLDFAGLEEALDIVMPPSEKSELAKMRIANLALGFDGLVARVERDVFKDAALKASYERFARIPLRLPMVQSVVDKYADKQPLKNTNVLMVQHMLGQAYPQIAGYKALGMNPEDAIFVGIPYHKNEEVEQAVAKSFGIDVRVPAKDMEALYRAIEKGVDDLVAKHLENGQPCLVVCDGPYAREYFMKKYPHLADKFRFTEQTAFGDRPEHRANKSIRCVSYARTHLKGREAEFVGQSVSRAVSRVMNQLKTGYEHKPVLILGTGSIGLATANAFAGDGAKVYVYDPKPTEEAIALAKEKGWTLLTNKSEISAGKFLMIGCSGYTSIDEEQILASDDNSIFVSASSKLVEINMKKLRELATDEEGNVRRVLAAEVNDQQTWHYWLKDGTIRTVIADGLPANFNDINVVPPEFIDMTMALSLAAAVEAMTGEDLGFFDLNAEDHGELDQQFNQFLEHLDVKAALAARDG